MSPLEITAAIVTLINVYLTIKNNLWCWPWGIASVLLYGKVFYDVHYYANAGLQIFYYLPMCIYGWWVWLRGGPLKNDDLPISLLSWKARFGWLALSLLLTWPMGWLLARYTEGKLTYLDSLTTALSIIAQYLMTHKRIENWVLWAVANVLYIYLMAVQQLWPTFILYIILLGMAFHGLHAWYKLWQRQPIPAKNTGKA